MLQSIDLTRLPNAGAKGLLPDVEYSGREVSPPALLIQQLVRAQNVFALHHGWPLHQLFAKHGRDKFCSILSTYWSRFCATWDVLLHGSPAVDMFPGLKLAAGGELGMGVGEEEWGSSERDVLEDFARRTEGLVDVVVSRFGEASPLQDRKAKAKAKGTARVHFDTPAEPWIGSGGNVAATDGVVFSGVGGLSRASLRDVAHWSETIYHYGDHAYGIRDNPTADRRKRRRRNLNAPTREAETSPAKPAAEDKSQPHDSGTGEAPRIPPPIVKAVERSLDKASEAIDHAEGRSEPAAKQETGNMLASLGDTETWMKYMTLGYGTAWGGKKQSGEEPEASAPAPDPTRREQSPEAMRYVEPAPDVDMVEEKRKAQVRAENDGYFLIGLKGDMVEADMDDENDEGNWNVRIPLRTIYVEQVDKDTPISESDETPGDELPQPRFKTGAKLAKQRLRPVVYVVCFLYSPLPPFQDTDNSYSTAPSSTPSSSPTAPLLSPSPPSIVPYTPSSPPSTAPSTATQHPRASQPGSSRPQTRKPPPRPPPSKAQTQPPSSTSSGTRAPSPCTPAYPISLNPAPSPPRASSAPRATEPTAWTTTPGRVSTRSTCTARSSPRSPPRDAAQARSNARAKPAAAGGLSGCASRPAATRPPHTRTPTQPPPSPRLPPPTQSPPTPPQTAQSTPPTPSAKPSSSAAPATPPPNPQARRTPASPAGCGAGSAWAVARR